MSPALSLTTSPAAVKAETIATFLGRNIAPNLAQEIGSQFSTRIEGTCIKHRFGKSSIKMYDKLGTILRIETTTNDVSSFKHYRTVEHSEGAIALLVLDGAGWHRSPSWSFGEYCPA